MIDSFRSDLDLVDAHCHLDLFDNPVALAGQLTRERVHTVAVTNAPHVFSYTENLQARSSFIHAAVGLHPELVEAYGHAVDEVIALLGRTRFVGEVGLDYSERDEAVRQRQRRVFERILEGCASHGDKTITVHSRKAARDVVDAVGPAFPGKVVLHWFTGSVRDLERAVDYGLYFSVNPAMTRTERGRGLIARMPPNRVLTESDGPFVKVDGRPARGNTSAMESLRCLAGLWKVSPSAAAAQVLRTAGPSGCRITGVGLDSVDESGPH